MRKRICIVICILVAAMITTLAVPVSAQAAEKAKITISKTKLTITQGKKKILKLTGAEGKVTWSSSDKKVATVGKSTGKVTAKSTGSAKITASVKVEGKTQKYVCRVTVKTAMKEQELGNLVISIPKSWSFLDVSAVYQTPAIITFDSKNEEAILTGGASNVTIICGETGQPALDYESLEAVYGVQYTEENLQTELAQQLGVETKVTDVKVESCKLTTGTALKVSYTIDFLSLEKKSPVEAYLLTIDNFIIQVEAAEIEDGTSPSPSEVAVAALNSIKVKNE